MACVYQRLYCPLYLLYLVLPRMLAGTDQVILLFGNAERGDSGDVGVLLTNLDLFNIWRTYSNMAREQSLSAVLAPCPVRHEAVSALCSQLHPQAACGCFTWLYDNHTLEQGLIFHVEIGQRELEELAMDIMKSNDVSEISILSDKGGLTSSAYGILRTEYGCDTAGGDIAAGQHMQQTRMPILNIVTDCTDQSPYHLVSTFNHEIPLMNPLINAVMLSSRDVVSMSEEGLPINVEHLVNLVHRKYIISITRLEPSGESWQGSGVVTGSTNMSVLTWSWARGYHTHTDVIPKLRKDFEGFAGRTLLVGLLQYPPFVTLVEDSTGSRYEGYCVDILYILAQALDFRVVLQDMNHDWGERDANGIWHGSIRDVMDGNIDILMTGMTISADRQAAVDFSFPFWEEKVGLLTVTVQKSNFYLFRPLHTFVWLCYVCMAILVGFLVFGIPRFEESTTGKNMIYLFGGLLCQGHPSPPKAGPARMILSSFWICVIVIVATYNANLMSFLTVSRTKLPFTALDQVVADPDYKLFVYQCGFSCLLMKQATGGVLADAWVKVNRDDSWTDYIPTEIQTTLSTGSLHVIMGDHTDLQTRAIESGYCNWGMLEDTFLPMGFGIAFAKGAPYKVAIDEVLMFLHAGGILEYLKSKHFRYLQESQCAPLIQATSGPLTLAGTWPVFAMASLLLVVSSGVLWMERLLARSPI